MLHINIKPQNRVRILIIFILGGIWGIVDMYRFKGLIEFAVDGFIILIITVILGNITNYVFNKFGFEFFKEKGQRDILDEIERKKTNKEIEDHKDIIALNYGIIWALIFVLLSI